MEVRPLVVEVRPLEVEVSQLEVVREMEVRVVGPNLDFMHSQLDFRLSHLTSLSHVLFKLAIEMLQFYLIRALLIPTCHPILLHI